MIFEQEGSDDYFEIVLTPEEIEGLRGQKSVLTDLPYGVRHLSVLIRKETAGEYNASSERKSGQDQKRVRKKRKDRNESGQAPKASSSNSIQ